MSNAPVRRKLAAILSADVQGYSRLMGDDEDATIRTLTAYREVMTTLIQAHHGRVVDSPGDNLLAEFGSAVEAVQGAVAIQEEFGLRNAELPEDRQMHYRIGINVGDVVVEGERIYGDGVNIAARLESLAPGGGVCISGNVYEQVKSKLPLSYVDRGQQPVKNIADPVRVYAVEQRVESEGAGSTQTADQREILSFPDKPSIAVLPFTNMSGDPEQEYFVDGMTEDIITELSRFQDLFVIARHSTFTYKGKAVTVQDVGRDLGVHYVLEGSVRKAGTRVRITVQLVDTASGTHHWAERYDRNVDDIFAVQDEVTQHIVATLPGRLEAADLERARRKPASSVTAYEYVLRGKQSHHRGTKEENAQALQMLEKAIELDPGSAEAHAWKACTLGQAVARGYAAAPATAEQIVQLVQTAYALDENNTECLRIMCEIAMALRDYEQAEAHNDKALTLNPNDPRIVAQKGEVLTWLGRPAEAVEWIEKAMRLDPFAADGWAHLLGRALYSSRQYSDALAAFKRISVPQFGQHAFMAACSALAGNDQGTRSHTRAVLELKEDFTVESYVTTLPYKDAADPEHCRDGLLKAGLPE